MSSQQATLDRMLARVDDLLRDFEACLDTFDANSHFGGRQLNLHLRTITRLHCHSTVTDALNDDLYCELLYSTLEAWGMNQRGARLVPLPIFMERLRAQAEAIEELSRLNIALLEREEVAETARRLWLILSNLSVSATDSQIVAVSKTLHHVLPSLVPPIDRKFTLTFFYGRPMLSITEREAFLEMYPRFHYIAVTRRPAIRARLNTGWHNSVSKIVDNAIIGYISRTER